MSWQVFTTEDAISQFTQAETAAIRTLQGSGSGWGSGSGDQYANVDIIVANVVDEVRGYIIAGGYPVDLTDDRTLPVGLFDVAIAITRWRLLISTPSFRQLQTEERKLAFEEALKFLESWIVDKPAHVRVCIFFADDKRSVRAFVVNVEHWRECAEVFAFNRFSAFA